MLLQNTNYSMINVTNIDNKRHIYYIMIMFVHIKVASSLLSTINDQSTYTVSASVLRDYEKDLLLNVHIIIRPVLTNST